MGDVGFAGSAFLAGVGARGEIKGTLDAFDFVRRQIVETVEEDAVCIGLVIGGELWRRIRATGSPVDQA